jgi:hypothetical protein
MKNTGQLAFLSAGFFLVLFVTQTATSQAVTPTAHTGTTIDWTPIIVALINLAFPAVAAVATYLINAHVKNQQMATLLNNAIQNGVGYIQQKTAAAVSANRADLTTTISAGNPAVQAGVDYVTQNAAEAINHFQIPNERIAQKLEAKLGLAEIQTNLAITQSPAPIIAGPLAPAPLGRVPLPSAPAG